MVSGVMPIARFLLALGSSVRSRDWGWDWGGGWREDLQRRLGDR